MTKILVSMIAYRERYLEESVRDCYEKAAFPENLIFSVVSEQSLANLHANLDFIPQDQIIYRKYELTEYRGVLWSRAKTVEIDREYDYILYTCGHNRFVESWDTKALQEYSKASIKSKKALLTVAAPEYVVSDTGSAIIDAPWLSKENRRRPQLQADYVPGYSWAELTNIPEDSDEPLEEVYLQFSWVFAPRLYVQEVPLDPDMNYHGEEIYTTVQTWCRGWRMFTTKTILYYHDTYKEYPGEAQSRMTTHRPWSDSNRGAFWEQSDSSMVKLNLLLSGRLAGIYGNISAKDVLNYCKFSGLNPKHCTYNQHYDKLPIKRHGEDFRFPPRDTSFAID